MNRREALAALAALPAVQSIARDEVRRGDVIVVECSSELTMESIKRMQEDIATIWPDNKCVVLFRELTMKIVREGE
jgi:hypothetical protein